MNIIVDKPQLVRVVLLYLNKNFGNLTPKTNSEFSNSVFYVNSDNEILMEYNKETERVYIHYDQIWSKFQSLFHLNPVDILSIMKVWLEEDYKLGNSKLRILPKHSVNHWKRLTNLNDI
jgi:hypothetical protein